MTYEIPGQHKLSPFTCAACKQERYLSYHGRYKCLRCSETMCGPCYSGHKCKPARESND